MEINKGKWRIDQQANILHTIRDVRLLCKLLLPHPLDRIQQILLTGLGVTCCGIQTTVAEQLRHLKRTCSAVQ